MSPDEKPRYPRLDTSPNGSSLDHGNCTRNGSSGVENKLDINNKEYSGATETQETILSTSQESLQQESTEAKSEKKFKWWSRFKKRIEDAAQPLIKHPLCPSYQRIARIIGVTLAVLICLGLSTCVATGRIWTRLGVAVAVAEAVGIIVHSTTALPPLLGMLLVGAATRNSGLMPDMENHYLAFYIVRTTALVVLMIRTGFRLNVQRIRSLSGLLVGLATLPVLAECVAITLMGHYLMLFPWTWALYIGIVLAAACPSVLRQSFFRMGGGQGLDAILLAAAGINDLCAISFLGIDMAVIFNRDMLLKRVMGVFGGVLLGCVYGIVARYVPQKNDPQVTALRSAMLLSIGLFAVFGGERINLVSGGPIACMVAAMVSSWGWERQGYIYTTKYNPVATTFDVLWRVMQPFMFFLIGTEIEVHALSTKTYTIGIGVLCCAWALRTGVALIVTSRGNLNMKEKIFISLAWLPKADVQAALGPWALDLARRRDDTGLVRPATDCLMLVLMAVVLTAPLSAALLGRRGLGPFLLGKPAGSAQPTPPSEEPERQSTE